MVLSDRRRDDEWDTEGIVDGAVAYGRAIGLDMLRTMVDA
jgi:hypothetical protein